MGDQLGRAFRKSHSNSILTQDRFNEGQIYYYYSDVSFDPPSGDRSDKFVVKHQSGACYRTTANSDDCDVAEFERVGSTGDNELEGTGLMSPAEERLAESSWLWADVMLREGERYLDSAGGLADARVEAALGSQLDMWGIGRGDADPLGFATSIAALVRNQFLTVGHSRTQSGAAQTTRTFAAGTYINMENALTNGLILDRVRIHNDSLSPLSLDIKIVERTALNTFSVVRSQTLIHDGVAGGYQNVRLTPYEIPASGSFYVGFHIGTEQTLDTRNVAQARAFQPEPANPALGDTDVTLTEETGDVPLVGVRYDFNYPKVGDLGMNTPFPKWDILSGGRVT